MRIIYHGVDRWLSLFQSRIRPDLLMDLCLNLHLLKLSITVNGCEIISSLFHGFSTRFLKKSQQALCSLILLIKIGMISKIVINIETDLRFFKFEHKSWISIEIKIRFEYISQNWSRYLKNLRISDQDVYVESANVMA